MYPKLLWKNKYARKRLDYYAIKSVLDAKLNNEGA